MKYFNIKRYKFSTILKKIYSVFNNTFTYIKHINLKKLYNYLDNIKKNFNFSNLAKKSSAYFLIVPLEGTIL